VGGIAATIVFFVAIVVLVGLIVGRAVARRRVH
jgi:hypothetical protein